MPHTVYYNENYTAATYAFDTTRKSADIAASLAGASHATINDPGESLDDTIAALESAHDATYRLAVSTGDPMDLAESQGFPWDPGIYEMALAHSNGLVAAVNDALAGAVTTGSLSSGLHHARSDHGEGYCTFNGLAVAATHALSKGVHNILVLDFDAHGGGGTRSMLDATSVTQIDVSTSLFDEWRPSPKSNDLYFYASQDDNYLETIQMALFAASKNTYDLVLYNAGMDPINTGVSAEDLAVREQLVVEWMQSQKAPVVYALAGGYTWGSVTDQDLVDLHRLTIDAMASA
jgi:acetoin utilization deacetylase AcuC-like enzyme